MAAFSRRTEAPEVRCNWTHRQTDRQTDTTTTVNLPAHARRGLKEAVRAAYIAQSAKRKAMFKAYHKANRSVRLKYFRKYHCCTKRKPVTKAKYRLAQPTRLVFDQYVNTVKANLRANAEAMSQLEETFKAQHGGVAKQLSKDDLEM